MPASSAQERIDALDRAQLLSTAQLDRIADVALAAQGAAGTGISTDWLIDFLGQREADGKLSAARRARFFDQAVRPRLDARPDVIAGDDLPFWVRYAGRGPRRGQWAHRDSIKEVWIDDGPKRRQGGSSSGSGFLNGGHGTSITVKTPGDHVLHVTADAAIYRGDAAPDDRDGKTTPHWSRTFTMSTPFKALPPDTKDYINLVDDPSQSDAIRKAIKLELRSTKYEWLSVSATIGDLPMNVAFDVVALVGGKEYVFGHYSAFAGGSKGAGFWMGAYRNKTSPTQAFDKVDILLRSSETVARGTVDLYEIWKGQILYKDVPVKADR
jgi:hypothetical protein